MAANASFDFSVATDAMRLPSGNNAQRPNGKPGDIRYSNTLNDFEGFTNTWSTFSSKLTVQNNNVFVNTTSTLDFSNGANVQLIVTDDYANGKINIFMDSTSSGGGVANIYSDQFICTANETVFTLNTTPSPANSANVILVAKNGLLLTPTVDYTLNANILTLTSNTMANDFVEVREQLSGGSGGGGSSDYQVDVYANGHITLANALLNFNNTTTINVAITSANSNTEANIAFNANVTAITATVTSIAEAAYGQANAAYTRANTANTTAAAAYGQANLAYTQANLAYTQANNAYTKANSVVANVSSGNTSNIVISGNSTNVIIDTALTGGSSPSPPGGIGKGLAYWLRGDILASYLANGVSTSALPDSTPNGLGLGPMYQVITSTTPNLPANTGVTLNNLPVLSFVGGERFAFPSFAGDQAASLGSGVFSANVTIFMVFNPINLTGGGTPVLFAGAGASGALDGFVYTSGEMAMGDGVATNKFSGGGVFANNTWIQANWSYGYDGNYRYQMRAASSDVADGSSGSAIFSITKGICSLGWYGTNVGISDDFVGYLAEAIWYNRLLSNTEISTIESYIHGKWGI